MSDPLKLELQTSLKSHVCAKNQTLKSAKGQALLTTSSPFPLCFGDEDLLSSQA